MRKIRESYTTEEGVKCDTCGNTDICFQHYKWNEGKPHVWLTQCGFCDEDTDPRGAETAENLQNPTMWPEMLKEREITMPKKEETDWLKLAEEGPYADIADLPAPTCVLPPKTAAEREYMLKRDISFFISRWITVRDDGVPVLDGTPEEFEKALKEFVDDYRTDW